VNTNKKIIIALGIFAVIVAYIPIWSMGFLTRKKKEVRDFVTRSIEELKTKKSPAELEKLYEEKIEKFEKKVSTGKVLLPESIIDKERQRLAAPFISTAKKMKQAETSEFKRLLGGYMQGLDKAEEFSEILAHAKGVSNTIAKAKEKGMLSQKEINKIINNKVLPEFEAAVVRVGALYAKKMEYEKEDALRLCKKAGESADLRAPMFNWGRFSILENPDPEIGTLLKSKPIQKRIEKITQLRQEADNIVQAAIAQREEEFTQIDKAEQETIEELKKILAQIEKETDPKKANQLQNEAKKTLNLIQKKSKHYKTAKALYDTIYEKYKSIYHQAIRARTTVLLEEFEQAKAKASTTGLTEQEKKQLEVDYKTIENNLIQSADKDTEAAAKELFEKVRAAYQEVLKTTPPTAEELQALQEVKEDDPSGLINTLDRIKTQANTSKTYKKSLDESKEAYNKIVNNLKLIKHPKLQKEAKEFRTQADSLMNKIIAGRKKIDDKELKLIKQAEALKEQYMKAKSKEKIIDLTNKSNNLFKEFGEIQSREEEYWTNIFTVEETFALTRDNLERSEAARDHFFKQIKGQAEEEVEEAAQLNLTALGNAIKQLEKDLAAVNKAIQDFENIKGYYEKYPDPTTHTSADIEKEAAEQKERVKTTRAYGYELVKNIAQSMISTIPNLEESDITTQIKTQIQFEIDELKKQKTELANKTAQEIEEYLDSHLIKLKKIMDDWENALTERMKKIMLLALELQEKEKVGTLEDQFIKIQMDEMHKAKKLKLDPTFYEPKIDGYSPILNDINDYKQIQIGLVKPIVEHDPDNPPEIGAEEAYDQAVIRYQRMENENLKKLALEEIKKLEPKAKQEAKWAEKEEQYEAEL